MVAKKPRVIVVGAGMAGLTAANRLHTEIPNLFDLTVVEAGHRLGGRILTSEFAGDRVEMGATWIHGILGSPIYDIARRIHALDDSRPWERMDGYPDDRVTVAEGGVVIDSSIVDPISALYRDLMDTVKAGGLPAAAGLGVGPFLRRGLHAYRASGDGITGVVGGGWTAEALEDAVFAMNENTERTYTSADDLAGLNLEAESEYREYPGEQISIAKGYSRVIEHLASALPPGAIRLGSKVRRIEWSPNGIGGPATYDCPPVRLFLDDGTILAADHIVLTVSLGVLKAGIREETKGFPTGLEFHPSLPSFKKEAIQRLGFGVVNKLFIEMESSGAAERFANLELAFDQQQVSERRAAKIPRWMRRTASICPIYGGSRVLLAWFAGKEAAELETLSDEEIIAGVGATLDGFSPAGAGSRYAKADARCNGSGAGVNGTSGYGGRVTRVMRSGWKSDSLFMGSYSYVAVGSGGDDLDLMGEPLPTRKQSEIISGPVAPLQILFAGEATHRTHYSTTHGAYLSGIREANRLIHHYHRA